MKAALQRLRLKLMRYEALSTLLDDLRISESLESIAELAGSRWKYLATISAWRLALPTDTGCSVLGGRQGQATAQQLSSLHPWDQHHWHAHHPRLLQLADLRACPDLPMPLDADRRGEWLVLPFERQGQRLGLLTVSSKTEPFSDLDHKFIRLFGSQLVDHAVLMQMHQRELQRLQGLAQRDALTGALNRAGILETAAAQLLEARRTGQPVSLIIADVDHFKFINDAHGHPVGDAVLCELAARFSEFTRAGEHFGRIGGEEFVFVLRPCSIEMALTAAERMRAAVADRPFVIHAGGGLDLQVTISLGVAGTEDGGSAALDQLLGHADEALYTAKRAGRNRVARHAASVDPQASP